jgi:DNA polymerase-3 subunit delta
VAAVAIYDKGALKNLRGLVGACSQLVADTTGAIDAHVVGRYFAGRAEVKSWEIADAVVEGRTADAASALRASLDTGTHPLLLVGALASSLRTLAKAKSAFAVPGLRSGDLARELGVPPFKVDIIRRQAGPWSHRGLAAAVVAVARADVAVKGGEESSAYALERAVAEVLAARALA